MACTKAEWAAWVAWVAWVACTPRAPRRSRSDGRGPFGVPEFPKKGEEHVEHLARGVDDRRIDFLASADRGRDLARDQSHQGHVRARRRRAFAPGHPPTALRPRKDRLG